MYKVNILPNGLTVVYEHLPYARSVSAGVWVLSGSRFEKISGMSHFIEHMLFKGTTTKSARQIAERMDAVGGQLNAYTTREYTNFYSLTRPEHLPNALELISDMVCHARFDEADIAMEKNVVEEEIAMYEDSPEDLVFDLLEEHAFFGHPLGRGICGTRESVRALSRQDILAHMEAFYTPANMVLSVAGAFDEGALLALSEQYFGAMSPGQSARPADAPPRFFSGEHTQTKDIEQSNLAWGFESCGAQAPERYALLVLSNAFGGGMSSRLFQKIREEAGLAYSVYTSLAAYRDIGLFSVYAALKENNRPRVLSIIDEEIKRLKRDNLTNDEIDRAKEQLIGGIVLSGEATSSHMASLGKGMLLRGRVIEEEEALRHIRAVTADDISLAAAAVFGRDGFLQVVRPQKETGLIGQEGV